MKRVSGWSVRHLADEEAEILDGMKLPLMRASVISLADKP
jgi:hypothetical protein